MLWVNSVIDKTFTGLNNQVTSIIKRNRGYYHYEHLLFCSVLRQSLGHFSRIFDNFVIGQYHWLINSIITQFAKDVPGSPIMHCKKARVYNGNIFCYLQCLMMMMMMIMMVMNCFYRMID